MSKQAFDKIKAGLEEAAAIAPYLAAIERKDAALAEIAKQKLTAELDEEESASAEFEEAYDAIIKIARAALEG